jgi:hypothetical protein
MVHRTEYVYGDSWVSLDIRMCWSHVTRRESAWLAHNLTTPLCLRDFVYAAFVGLGRMRKVVKALLAKDILIEFGGLEVSGPNPNQWKRYADLSSCISIHIYICGW